MASSSSSTRKAARLAQRGKGQRVRFQGGALFPLVVAIVVVVGFLLVVYARESRPAADASSPTVDDHWHHVYGFLLCDEWFQLSGDGEDRAADGTPTNTDYVRSGVHSHDDGLIHWHAFSSVAVGSRAKLGVFLDTYDVELTNSKLTFPEEQRALLPYQQEDGVFENGETECEIVDEDGNVSVEDASLSVVRWNSFTDTDDGTTFIADFDNIALNQDGRVIVIAFVPDGADVPMPPWAPELEERAAIDQDQLQPDELFPDVEFDEDGDVVVEESLTDVDSEVSTATDS